MTAFRLFRPRFFENLRFQIKSWRLGIDWTVLVYMLVPALVFMIAVYHSWWSDLPGWMSELPFEGFLLIFYIVAWMGTLRLFIEEADQLFLLQKRSLYLSLRTFGIVYSLMKAVIGTALFLALFLPYLISLSYSAEQIFQLFAVLSLWKSVILLIKETFLHLIAKRLVRFVMFVAMFIIILRLYVVSFSAPGMQFYTWIALIIIGSFLFHWKARAAGHFYSEVERELDSKFRVASLLLMQSGVIEQRKPKQRRKPWIFRRSNRWFARRDLEWIVIEQYTKAWLRKPQNIFSYIRFLGFSIAALLLFPGGWNLLVLMLILFLFYQMVRAEWEAYEQSPYIQMIVRGRNDLSIVRRRIWSIFLLPASIILIIVHGLISSNWLTALVLTGIVFYFILKPWFKRDLA